MEMIAHPLRLSLDVALNVLAISAHAHFSGPENRRVSLRGRTVAEVEGVGTKPVQVSFCCGAVIDDSFGIIETGSSEGLVHVDLSSDEWTTLLASRLSARELRLRLRVLGGADRVFDDLDLTRNWRVKSYLLEMEDAPHPPTPSPQGRGEDE